MSEEDDAAKQMTTEKKITKKPSTMDMLMKAIESNTERKGISVPAIKNYIKENYPSASTTTLKTRLKSALSLAMEKDQIRRPKASMNKESSLTGRYVLSEQKKVSVRAPKPVDSSKATKAKQPKEKKTAAKKTTAKKTAAKEAETKTPPPKKSKKGPAKDPQTPAQVSAAISKKLVKKAISTSSKLHAKQKSTVASAKKPLKEGRSRRGNKEKAMSAK